jgi:hypothetical protein
MACADAVIFVWRESERGVCPEPCPVRPTGTHAVNTVVVVSPLPKERSPALPPGPLIYAAVPLGFFTPADNHAGRKLQFPFSLVLSARFGRHATLWTGRCAELTHILHSRHAACQ